MFNMGEGHNSLVEGVGRVKCPVLVLGVTSDVLFPVEQQREMVTLLKEAGKTELPEPFPVIVLILHRQQQSHLLRVVFHIWTRYILIGCQQFRCCY